MSRPGSSSSAERALVLDRVPTALLSDAVAALEEAARECQLIVLGGAVADDDALLQLATDLVPSIEAVADAFRSATVDDAGDGTVRLVGRAPEGFAEVLADLPVHLVSLRRFRHTDRVLVDIDPPVVALVVWMCTELDDQLAGRPPQRCSVEGGGVR